MDTSFGGTLHSTLQKGMHLKNGRVQKPTMKYDLLPKIQRKEKLRKRREY